MKMVFMMVLRAMAAALAVGSLLVTTACGQTSGDPAGGAQRGPLNIVVAFYPFQFLAERIAGRYGAVQNLTKPGAEPHDVELSPRQVADIAGADLVIYERSFQPAVDAAVEQQGGDQVLDTATVVRMESLDQGHDQPGGQENGRDQGTLDPHVWLAPPNMASIAAAVAARLAEADPAHRTDFEANLTALTADLTALDRDFALGLQACERREFITSHAAFGYLARQYRLEQIAIGGLAPEAEPSPTRIAEVQDQASEHQITTIFYETLVSPAVAKSIAGDLGLRTDVLDPVEGITDQSRGSDYVAVMRSNLTALRKANECR
jgi:zinc transport system substrate-binding protein